MKPILFEPSATAFDTLGLGVLADATSCEVTEERNGVYELQMQYPITGQHYSSISNRAIIYTEVNRQGDKQPFRVYRITRPMRGIVTIHAQHLSYDLSGIVLTPFDAENINAALAMLKTYSSTDNPFTFTTDRSTVAKFSVGAPSTVRSIMGGQSGSLLDVYGGEYAYDHYAVKLLKARGGDRGATIRYGKNLTDLTQEENIQNVVTGLYPYWKSEDSYVELPEKIVNAPGTYDFVKIKPLDASSEFDEEPSVEKLRSYAESYAKSNDIGVPSVSITVKFAALDQTEEYKDIAMLEEVNLCDTVTVAFDRLGVNVAAKCIKTVYDVLKGRYKEIALGEAKTNITDTILLQGEKVEQVADPAFMAANVNAATQLITGNRGGYVVLHSSAGKKTPDEILIMDTDSPKTAKKVWRWNKSGLGYSATGYGGPYGLAMTIDGQIVADFISTGTLDAENITVKNLWADKVRSENRVGTGLDRTALLEISTAEMKIKVDDETKLWITLGNDGDSPQIGLYNNNVELAGLSDAGVSAKKIIPATGADFKWKYISTLGETVLVKN